MIDTSSIDGTNKKVFRDKNNTVVPSEELFDAYLKFGGRLKFAAINLKKLAKWKWSSIQSPSHIGVILIKIEHILQNGAVAKRFFGDIPDFV